MPYQLTEHNKKARDGLCGSSLVCMGDNCYERYFFQFFRLIMLYMTTASDATVENT